MGRYHHDASTSLNNAKEAARVSRRHTAALTAQLETTNAALNHAMLVWVHTERACTVKEESLITRLTACQSKVKEGKEREKQLKDENDRRSKNEDNLQARLDIASEMLDHASSEARKKPARKTMEPKEAERPRREGREKGGWISTMKRVVVWSIIILGFLLYCQYNAVRFCYKCGYYLSEDICRGLGRGFVQSSFTRL